MKWDCFRSPESGPGSLIHLGQVVAADQSEAYAVAAVCWRILAGEKLEVFPAAAEHSPLATQLVRSIAHEVLKSGQPKRVLVGSGRAVSPARAKALSVPIDVVFVRRDGWTLGAPLYLLADAEACWPEHWVAVVDMVKGRVVPYCRVKS